jgi:hypothetical protein
VPALIDVQSYTPLRHAVMVWLNRIALAVLWLIFGIAGCAGPPQPIALSVSPASAEVAAGSSTTFTAKLTSGSPLAGNVTWSVAPATGGTISSEGVYTASGAAGSYTIVATLTLVNSAPGGIFSGSAAVEVLPAPQIDAQLNPDLVQASGANQTFGAIQNSVILGQLFPSVISTDPNGDIQVRSGFTPPLACRNSNTVCD